MSGTITENGRSVSFTAANESLDYPQLYLWKDLDESTLREPGPVSDNGREAYLDSLELGEGETAFANGVRYMAVEVARLPDTSWKEWKISLG